MMNLNSPISIYSTMLRSSLILIGFISGFSITLHAQDADKKKPLIDLINESPNAIPLDPDDATKDPMKATLERLFHHMAQIAKVPLKVTYHRTIKDAGRLIRNFCLNCHATMFKKKTS